MKKFLSVMLCLALLFAVLCSCGGNTVKEKSFTNKLKENPTNAMLDLAKDSAKEIVSQNEVLDIVSSAICKGTVSANFPYSYGEVDVNATIYSDKDADKHALLVSLDCSEDSYLSDTDFAAYVNKTVLSFKDTATLGDTIYGIDFKTLYEDLSNWSLWEDCGVKFTDLDNEGLKPVLAMCEIFGNPEKTKEFNKKELLKAIELLNKCAAVEELDKDGVKAVVLSYEFTEEDVYAVGNVFLDLVKQYCEKLEPGLYEFFRDVTTSDIFGTLPEDYVVSISICFNQESEDVMSVAISGKTPYEYSAVLDFGTGFKGASEYKFSYSVIEAGLSSVVCDANFVKTVTENKTEYRGKITANEETADVTLTKGSTEDELEYRFIATSGEYELKAGLSINKKEKSFKAYRGDTYGQSQVIEGSYIKDTNTFGVTVGDVSVAFVKNGEIEFPGSYKKITDLSTESFTEIFLEGDFMNGEFEDIFSSLFWVD